MSTFLLDANLSPETRAYLVATFGLDVTDLITLQRGHLPDADVVALAKREQRVIVTFDLDLGEIYHRRERGNLGVIILRLANQTVESVNEVLGRFFQQQADAIDLDRSLVIIEKDRVRIATEP